MNLSGQIILASAYPKEYTTIMSNRIIAIALLSLTIALSASAKADSGIVKGPGLSFGSIAKRAPACRIVETRDTKGKLIVKNVCTKR